MKTTQVLKNITVASMDLQRTDADNPYGLVSDAALVIQDDQIAWLGRAQDLPEQYQAMDVTELDGRLVTPALIDCHTHLVHGGSRATEFEMRLEGQSYEAIAKAGGGIVSTVKATREASEETLLEIALERIDWLLSQGVSTVEIKSGYGLDEATELKMLRVAREIAKQRPIDVQTTYLGAHAIPKGMDADTYIDTICIPTLRKAHQASLVDAVDGFCEKIAFNTAQIRRVFDVAKSLNLPIKLHAEQLSHSGGTALAAEYGALSVDHVEYITTDDVKAMAAAGSVAVLLPGAFYAVRETQLPPIDGFRQHGVPMAVSTDWNPGSSPLGSLLMAMNMACTLFRLTPAESLAGVTRHAAQALGLDDRGVIASGKRADLAIWNLDNPAELSYRMGQHPIYSLYLGGHQCR